MCNENNGNQRIPKLYPKIPNLFKFNSNYNNIVGLNEPFKTLAENPKMKWRATEKIDGTNTRIYWDGYRVSCEGRTAKSVFPPFVTEFLNMKFCENDEFETALEQVFSEKEVIIFGETFGPKIQNKGDQYGKEIRFIVFDIAVLETDGKFHMIVNPELKASIALQLGLSVVERVFESAELFDIVKYVAQHHQTLVGDEEGDLPHEMEGVIIEPVAPIFYDRDGNILKCKCKYRDLVKGGAIELALANLLEKHLKDEGQ